MNIIHYVIGTTTKYDAPIESLHNIDYQTLNPIHPLNMLQTLNDIQLAGVPTRFFFRKYIETLPAHRCKVQIHYVRTLSVQ